VCAAPSRWRDGVPRQRGGFRKTLSFSVVRDETIFNDDTEQPPITIKCPCTACGHLNEATFREADINCDGSAGTQAKLRIVCKTCGSGLSVKVTKRDPRLSI